VGVGGREEVFSTPLCALGPHKNARLASGAFYETTGSINLHEFMNFGIQFSAPGMNRGEISEYSSFDELSRVFGIFLEYS
jgi:hypothetical protein